ncbi:hypothetical protein QL285_005599 [Trifolium repens]|nr:hypothetical protein QL285_005599 [Trifolium repens]
MLITVILDGNFNEKYDVQVERDTVGVLKKKIAEVLQIPFKGQRLVVSHGPWNFMEDDTKNISDLIDVVASEDDEVAWFWKALKENSGSLSMDLCHGVSREKLEGDLLLEKVKSKKKNFIDK